MPENVSFQLKVACATDIGFLLKLRLATMEPHLVSHGVHLTLEQHRERVEHEFEHCYLIVAAGYSVGALKYINDQAFIEIKQLQILPKDQGKGLGQAVLANLLAEADAERKPVKLSVLRQNRAFGLYRRMGFQVVGEDHLELHMLRPMGV